METVRLIVQNHTAIIRRSQGLHPSIWQMVNHHMEKINSGNADFQTKQEQQLNKN